MNDPFQKSRVFAFLGGLLFIAFTANAVYLISSEVTSNAAINEKAERMVDVIGTICADSLADYDIDNLQKTMESVFANKDVAFLQVSDNEGKVLVKLTRSGNWSREFSIRRVIEKNNQSLGSVDLILTNNSIWENAEKTSDIIVRSNVENIWDYNIEALENSLNSFFKDKSLKSIKVVEPNGNVILELQKHETGREKLTLSRPISKTGTLLGYMEFVFTDYPLELQRKRHLALIAVSTIIFAVLMTLSFTAVIRNIKSEKEHNRQFSKENRAHWTITPSVEGKIEKALEYIKENYTRDISREGLASMLDMNADNFGRYFKLYTKERISDYINRLRVDEAAKKLIETEDTIVNIAFNVGFENISTFNRLFRQIKQLTPSEFREKNRTF